LAPTPAPIPPPEPEVEASEQAEVNNNGSSDGFSMDLIQKDLEQRQAEVPAAEPELPPKLETPPPAEAPPAAAEPGTAPISSDAMDLIRRHLEQKVRLPRLRPPHLSLLLWRHHQNPRKKGNLRDLSLQMLISSSYTSIFGPNERNREKQLNRFLCPPPVRK